MISDDEFLKRLDSSLAHYQNSINLIDKLLGEKQLAQEIILISCSRLDSLANLAFPDISSQQKSFCRFISNYSAEKQFFNSVSVGDLYWYLLHNSDFAYIMIDKPGRIERLGTDDELYIEFIARSKVPVTGDSVYKYSIKLCKQLQGAFRVKPRQRLNKKYLASSSQIKDVVSKNLGEDDRENICFALEPLLDYFKCSSILYREYRNQAIHGLRVSVNEEDFFSETKPFHTEAFSSEHGAFFQIEFPGKYLRDLLSTTFHTFKHHLGEKKKLPIDLFNAMFDFEEVLKGDVIEYIADEAFSGFGEVKWQLRSR